MSTPFSIVPFGDSQSRQTILTILWLLLPSISMAVTPDRSHYILGMNIQGQRLNLYSGCTKDDDAQSVTCSDMSLVASDLAYWPFAIGKSHHRVKPPLDVKAYPAMTNFKGYKFADKHISGFIDTSNNTIKIMDKVTRNKVELSYKTVEDYLPLIGQSTRIDSQYATSDAQLNNSYQATKKEVAQLYGYESATDLKQDQIAWLIRRSTICGADRYYRPRSQAEKVCFIQQNDARIIEYYLWID
ncbi:lysozyme inhibitor LprI family protein [Psychrobacter pygoscelis]|uniref:lysozyme inhibitor LprI family protein n=1 Tax=Psychrobacter pygoscelis TaxID=2488563 RepID=UPI00103EE6E7|nr:lysozyme inhibitor LprI family protein [Psychrobacter pygoscelis]